jgi:hypothetical protein
MGASHGGSPEQSEVHVTLMNQTLEASRDESGRGSAAGSRDQRTASPHRQASRRHLCRGWHAGQINGRSPEAHGRKASSAKCGSAPSLWAALVRCIPQPEIPTGIFFFCPKLKKC